MSLAIFDERIVNETPARIVLATGTGLLALTSSQTGGCRVDEISVTSTSVANRVLELVYTVGGVDYLLGSITIPAGQGTLGTPPIFLAASLAPVSLAGWVVHSTGVLKVRVTLALLAGEQIDVVSWGGVF